MRSVAGVPINTAAFKLYLTYFSNHKSYDLHALKSAFIALNYVLLTLSPGQVSFNFLGGLLFEKILKNGGYCGYLVLHFILLTIFC